MPQLRDPAGLDHKPSPPTGRNTAGGLGEASLHAKKGQLVTPDKQTLERARKTGRGLKPLAITDSGVISGSASTAPDSFHSTASLNDYLVPTGM